MTRNGHQRHRTCGFGGKRTLLRIAVAQLALSVVLIGALAAASIFDIRGNGSPSEPRGIYRLTHEPLIRGAHVVLKLPLKQIAALPGDTVRVTLAGSYVTASFGRTVAFRLARRITFRSAPTCFIRNNSGYSAIIL